MVNTCCRCAGTDRSDYNQERFKSRRRILHPVSSVVVTTGGNDVSDAEDDVPVHAAAVAHVRRLLADCARPVAL